MSVFFLLLFLASLGIAVFYLRKLFRACDAANRTEWNNKWLNRIDGLNRLFCHRYHRMPYEFVPIPQSGPVIVVANHNSGLDPLILMASSNRPLRFLVAREEYERFGFTWLFKAVGCIPVDRASNPGRALHEALAALNDGDAVAIFPHGGIHWPTNLEFKIKGGAVRLAQRKNCAIYPVFISGVRLKGFTLPSLLVRSDIDLTYYDAMECDAVSYDQCMDSLAQILNQSESNKH